HNDQDYVLPGLYHLRSRPVLRSCMGLRGAFGCGWSYGRHIPFGGSMKKSSCYYHHDGEQYPHNVEAVADSVGLDQQTRHSGNIDCRSPESTDDQAHDQASFVLSEPFDRGRNRAGVAYPHAYAAQNAETDDQTCITAHEACDDTSERQGKPADSDAHLGTVFVLDAPTGNHACTEHEPAQGICPRGLGIRHVCPAGIYTPHDGPGDMVLVSQ